MPTSYEHDTLDDEMDSYEHDPVEDDDSLSAALAAEWGSAPWYVSSVGVHLVLFLILFLIPITPPDEPEPTLELTTQIIEEEEEKEDEEEPEVEVVEKEKIDQEITETPVEVPEITEVNIEITDHFETEDEVDDATAAGDPDNMASFDSEFTGTPALMGVGASGGGGGGGGGRFGNRGRGGRKKALMRGGGSKKTESAVNWALKWLAAHQASDGHWDALKYGGKKHSVTDEEQDIAMTSLSLLAFLGAGNSVQFGQYKDNVKRGVLWLMSKQSPAGNIGHGRHYVAGIALMAIAEAYGMSEGHPLAKKIGDAAQKAVDYGVKVQNASGAWGYAANSSRDDQSVTSWWVMGMKSAYIAGLNVPSAVFTKARKFHLYMTSTTGTSGYTAPNNTNGVPLSGIRMAAVANTCLQFLGEARNSPKVLATANAVIQEKYLPVADDAKKDFYLTYYQALGLFQMGVKSKYWKVFNKRMKKMLLATQVMVGTVKENKGSWNWKDDPMAGEYTGRVGETALGALMLEIYYRYKEGTKVGQRH